MSSPGRRAGARPAEATTPARSVTKSATTTPTSRRAARRQQVEEVVQSHIEGLHGFPPECTVIGENFPSSFTIQNVHIAISWYCPVVYVNNYKTDRRPTDPRAFLIVLATPEMAEKLIATTDAIFNGLTVTFSAVRSPKSVFEMFFDFIGWSDAPAAISATASSVQKATKTVVTAGVAVAGSALDAGTEYGKSLASKYGTNDDSSRRKRRRADDSDGDDGAPPIPG